MIKKKLNVPSSSENGKSNIVRTVSNSLTCMTSYMMTLGVFQATETSVGTGLVNGGKKFINELTVVYCDSLGWLAFGICLLFTAFTKNEKVATWAKRGLFLTFVTYIVLKILNTGNGGAFGATADTIVTWVS